MASLITEPNATGIRGNASFISDAEEIVDEVAEWGADYVERVVNALSPDGRPFGMEKRSDAEAIAFYVENLRGNVDAWANRIRQMVAKGQQELAQAGLTPDLIAGVHLYDIAQRICIDESATMERKLRARQEKARKETEVPTPDDSPPDPFEDEVESDATG